MPNIFPFHRSSFRFSHLLSSRTAFTALATLAAAATASAHIGYGGRDFGTLTPGTSTSITNQTVSSNFGFADATDTDYGDSHRGRFYRFKLTQVTSVSITAQRNTLGTGANGVFLPAISLYLGLGAATNPALIPQEQASHDSAALSVSSRPVGTEGSLRALADWSIGNDPTYLVAGDPTSGIRYTARLANFTYMGNFADGTAANYGPASGINGDGLADGFITGTFSHLAAGDYSLFIGGADYAANTLNYGTPAVYPTYGVSVTVQAIPEPATSALAAGVLALGLIHLRRRSRYSL